MSEKIGILVCGNSGVDYVKLDFPVKVIRSTLLMDKKEYEDFVDITAEEFYDVIANNPDIDLSTSQTATGKIAEVYEEFKKEGYTDVIVVSIASKLSGTYQGAVVAAELVEGINVHVVDSRSVSEGEMYLVETAIEMIGNGIKVPVILDKLNEIRDNVNIYVLVDTLKFLVKNGRLSATSGILGSLLKIKPLLKLKKDGSLVPHEKIRTTNKARLRLLEIIKTEIQGKNVDIFIAYTNNIEEAERMKKELTLDNKDQNVKIVPLTPVVGAHAGPGTLAIGYIEKK